MTPSRKEKIKLYNKENESRTVGRTKEKRKQELFSLMMPGKERKFLKKIQQWRGKEADFPSELVIGDKHYRGDDVLKGLCHLSCVHFVKLVLFTRIFINNIIEFLPSSIKVIFYNEIFSVLTSLFLIHIINQDGRKFMENVFFLGAYFDLKETK